LLSQITGNLKPPITDHRKPLAPPLGRQVLENFKLEYMPYLQGSIFVKDDISSDIIFIQLIYL